MSRSTLICFKGEKGYCEKGYQNSWGTLPVVWEFMYHKYLTPNSDYETYLQRGNDICSLYKNNEIPLHHRALILFTCDRCTIKKIDSKRFAEDIRLFLEDYPPKENRVNHWEQISKDVVELDFDEFGLWCTSLSHNPFYCFCQEQDEEEEDSWKPPSEWFDRYDIYEELDKEKEEAQR